MSAQRGYPYKTGYMECVDQVTRLGADVDCLRDALREILEDPDAKILDSHRDMGWAAIHKATGEQP